MNLTRRQLSGDSDVDSVREVCKKYELAHPDSEAKSYRQNLGSIRFRVIDPAFATMDYAERYRKAWHFLTVLSPDVQGQISVFLLLTPEEASTSFANMDFENPTRSRL